MTELPCWALVLLTAVGVLCAALVLAVLARRGAQGGKASRKAAPESVPAASAPPAADAGPEEVDPDHIASWLESHPQAVLLFYAPWCAHCHAMLPHYAEAAAGAAAGGVSIGQVNCDTSPQVPSLYGLRGFPTVLRFVHGDVHEEYQGDRSAQSLSAFMAPQ